MSLLTPDQVSDYERDGYVVVRGLFTNEETGLLGETARNDNAMAREDDDAGDTAPPHALDPPIRTNFGGGTVARWNRVSHPCKPSTLSPRSRLGPRLGTGACSTMLGGVQGTDMALQ